MRLKEWQLVALALSVLAATAALAYFAAHWQLAAPRLGARCVAVIRLEGTIAYSTSQLALLGATADPDEISKLIDRAASDDSIGAVVLLINSPGGSAAASEALYAKVRELAARKPVVAYVREYGTSGAYMVALPARAILASNSSIVGSVGVYVSVLTYTGLLEKLGVKVHVFRSGELKDLGAGYRELTPRDAQVLEEVVSDLFDLFKRRVLAHRSLRDPGDVFTGRPFTARQALERGLIDGVGTLDDALRLARELGGLPPDAPVLELRPPRPSLLQLLLRGYPARSPVAPSIEILAMRPPPIQP